MNLLSFEIPPTHAGVKNSNSNNNNNDNNNNNKIE